MKEMEENGRKTKASLEATKHKVNTNTHHTQMFNSFDNTKRQERTKHSTRETNPPLLPKAILVLVDMSG